MALTNPDGSPQTPEVPDTFVTTAQGRRITATRERYRTDPPEKTRRYWVITIDGERYPGWLAYPGETEASLRAELEKWIDKHPLTLQHRPGTA